jgi:hypothetical protein
MFRKSLSTAKADAKWDSMKFQETVFITPNSQGNYLIGYLYNEKSVAAFVNGNEVSVSSLKPKEKS